MVFVYVLLSLVGLLFIIYPFYTYNSMVSYRNRTQNAFATIDVMLKKRYDLIPNLVSIAQAYVKHENELLVKITKCRSNATQNEAKENEIINLNNELSGCLKTLMIAIEAYPDLKASDTFLKLQKKLAYIEANLSAARRSYNMYATLYNVKVDSFPSNILAKIFDFKRKALLEACESTINYKPEIKTT